jgi:hypothetical protein
MVASTPNPSPQNELSVLPALLPMMILMLLSFVTIGWPCPYCPCMYAISLRWAQ